MRLGPAPIIADLSEGCASKSSQRSWEHHLYVYCVLSPEVVDGENLCTDVFPRFLDHMFPWENQVDDDNNNGNK